MFLAEQSPQILAQAEYAAAVAGLRYVSDEDTPGISRARHGTGFTYRGTDGKAVRDSGFRRRVAALAIPPAWTEVWISPDPDAHIAATGRDAKGRKQYRYNPAFVEVRGLAKFGHLIAFAQALPRIRKAVDAHLRLRGMPREKVLATIIALLEKTLIRVGNAEYAEQNKSYGLTPRELEVVSCVVAGCSNRDIAQQFQLSEETIKRHLSNIFEKTGVSTRLELALFAIERRLVAPRS